MAREVLLSHEGSRRQAAAQWLGAVVGLPQCLQDVDDLQAAADCS
jgi:hypothetical protein